MKLAERFYRALNKRISKLEGGIVASADALADLEYRHLKRIEALEEKHNHKPIFDRLSAPEEKFERSLPSFEDMKGIYKEKPALKTCGECAHPCWSAEIPTNGVCFWHPLATVEIRKALGKRNYPEPVRIDDDACPNFEALE